MKVTFVYPNGQSETPTFWELVKNSRKYRRTPLWKTAITWIAWHTLWRKKEITIKVEDEPASSPAPERQGS